LPRSSAASATRDQDGIVRGRSPDRGLCGLRRRRHRPRRRIWTTARPRSVPGPRLGVDARQRLGAGTAGYGPRAEPIEIPTVIPVRPLTMRSKVRAPVVNRDRRRHDQAPSKHRRPAGGRDGGKSAERGGPGRRSRAIGGEDEADHRWPPAPLSTVRRPCRERVAGTRRASRSVPIRNPLAAAAAWSVIRVRGRADQTSARRRGCCSIVIAIP
jgi:hypothetical protein